MSWLVCALLSAPALGQDLDGVRVNLPDLDERPQAAALLPHGVLLGTESSLVLVDHALGTTLATLAQPTHDLATVDASGPAVLSCADDGVRLIPVRADGFGAPQLLSAQACHAVESAPPLAGDQVFGALVGDSLLLTWVIDDRGELEGPTTLAGWSPDSPVLLSGEGALALLSPGQERLWEVWEDELVEQPAAEVVDLAAWAGGRWWTAAAQVERLVSLDGEHSRSLDLVPDRLLSADVDGDGVRDVVIADTAAPALRLLSAELTSRIEGVDASADLAAGDLDGDDCQELVALGGGGELYLVQLEPCLAPTDADGDGWRLQDGDCDDSDAAVYPGAEELCDEVDQDCDGVADRLSQLEWLEDGVEAAELRLGETQSALFTARGAGCAPPSITYQVDLNRVGACTATTDGVRCHGYDSGQAQVTASAWGEDGQLLDSDSQVVDIYEVGPTLTYSLGTGWDSSRPTSVEAGHSYTVLLRAAAVGLGDEVTLSVSSSVDWIEVRDGELGPAVSARATVSMRPPCSAIGSAHTVSFHAVEGQGSRTSTNVTIYVDEDWSSSTCDGEEGDDHGRGTRSGGSCGCSVAGGAALWWLALAGPLWAPLWVLRRRTAAGQRGE